MDGFLDELGKITGKPLAKPAEFKQPKKNPFDTKSEREALERAASKLGVNPLDLATVIDYETIGTYSPTIRGGKNNKYRGLIQFGEEEYNKYKVGENPTFESQIENSVVPFFQDRFKQVGRKTQGATLLDLYKTVNGGNPNVSEKLSDNRKDTIKSHVERMSKLNRQRALQRFFGGVEPTVEQSSGFLDELKKLSLEQPVPQSSFLDELKTINQPTFPAQTLPQTVEPPQKFDKQGNMVSGIGGEVASPEIVNQPIPPVPTQPVPTAPVVPVQNVPPVQAAPQNVQVPPQTPVNPAIPPEQAEIQKQYNEWLAANAIPDSAESRTQFNEIWKGLYKDINARNREAARLDQQNQQPVPTPQNQIPQNVAQPDGLKELTGSYRYEGAKNVLDFRNKLESEVAKKELEAVPGATMEDIKQLRKLSPLFPNVTENLVQSNSGNVSYSIKPAALETLAKIRDRRIEIEEKKERASTRALLDNISLSQALFDEGLLNEEQFAAAQKEEEEFKRKEEEAKAKYIAETRPDTSNVDVTKFYPEELSTGKLTLGQARQQYQLNAQKDSDERMNEILAKYGSFQQYYKDKDRIEKEYKYRYLARPVEFATNIGRYFLKLPSTLVKAEEILTTDLNPFYEGIKASETPYYKAAQAWNERVDASKNKDLQDSSRWDDFIANEVSQGVAQLMAQGILAPFTGGASLALPVTEAAVNQYEEADKAGAGRGQRNIALMIGGLAAIPDAILKSRYLKALNPANKTKFLDNLTTGVFNNLSKQLPEEEARRLTVQTISEFVKQASKNGVVNFGKEYVQESVEDVTNKTVAKLTYKPDITWTDVFIPNAQEKRGYLAAGIIGAFGGNLNLVVEKMSPPELERSDEVLADALAKNLISQENAAALAREIKAKMERDNINLNPSGTVAALAKQSTESLINKLSKERPYPKKDVVYDEQGKAVKLEEMKELPELPQIQAEVPKEDILSPTLTKEIIDGANEADKGAKQPLTVVATEEKPVIPVEPSQPKKSKILDKDYATQENIPEAKIPESPVEDAPKVSEPKISQEKVAEAKTVRVGDKDVTLTPEQAERWKTEVEEPLAKAKAEYQKSLKAPDASYRESAAKAYKAKAFQIAAVKREITGQLTPLEQRRKERQEKSNYLGKEVSVDGKNAKVVGTPFGKVKVKFDDGTEKTFTPDKIQPISAPQTKEAKIVGGGEINRDVQRRNEALRKAETDVLTGVANRAALDKALPSAESDPNTSVISFDANNFGKINKVVSQEKGDEVLKELSDSIRQAAGEFGVENRVFRRGGDEFVVLAPKDVANKIQQRAEEIFGERTYGEGESSVKVSLTGTTAPTFNEADSILQEAKQKRKGVAEETSKQKKRSLPKTLREAGLEANDEFYQMFSDEDARKQADKTIDDIGLENSIKLLENKESYDKADAVVSVKIQRALLSEANKAESEGDTEYAEQLRTRSLELASKHAGLATKAGQFNQAAAMLAPSADGVIYRANKIASEKGKGLSQSDYTTFETLGIKGEESFNNLEIYQNEIAKLKERIVELESGKGRPLERYSARVTTRARAKLPDQAELKKRVLEKLRPKLASQAGTAVVKLGKPTDETIGEVKQYGAGLLLNKPLGEIRRDDFYAEMRKTFGKRLDDQLPKIFADSLNLRNKLLKDARFEMQNEKLKAEFPDASEVELQTIAKEREKKQEVKRATGNLAKKLASLYSPIRAKEIQKLIELSDVLAEDTDVSDYAERILTKESTPEDLKRKNRNLYFEAQKLIQEAKKQLVSEREAIKEEIAAGKENLKILEREEFFQRQKIKQTVADLAREYRRLEENPVKFFGKEGLRLLGETRSILASGDLSGALRQGFYFTITNPLTVFKGAKNESGETLINGAFGGMLRSFSEVQHADLMKQIENHPNFNVMLKMGIEFASAGTDFSSLTSAEENVRTEYAKKIPGLKTWLEMSERTYSGFLDLQRALIADSIIKEFESQGVNLKDNLKDYEAAGKLINIATGRGNLTNNKSLNDAVNSFGRVLFAPRYAVSRFQLLSHLAGGAGVLPPVARKIALKRAMRFHSAISLPLIAAGMLGLVSLDPDDDDFLKVRIGGKARYEVTGGLQSYLRYLAQMGKAVYGVSGDTTVKEAGKKIGGTNLNFWTKKLAPVPSYIYAGVAGKEADTSEFHWAKGIGLRLLPITLKEFGGNTYEDGVTGFIATIPSIFGIGTGYYPDKTKETFKQQREDLRKALPKDATKEERKEFRQKMINSKRQQTIQRKREMKEKKNQR